MIRSLVMGGLALALSTCTPAFAQNAQLPIFCVGEDKIDLIKENHKKQGFEVVFQGLAIQGQLLTVSRTENEQWIVELISPKDRSMCLLASGEQSLLFDPDYEERREADDN